MSSIKFYIANATGDFSKSYIDKIESVYIESEKIIIDRLNANKIDIIFVNSPYGVISEIGIGGIAPGPHNIYISLDPKRDNWSIKNMLLTICHESHHCMRWRKPGYGNKIGEEIISEGLATLFEEEVGNETPIYAKVDISSDEIKEVKQHLNDKSQYAKHQKWFYGTDEIQKWFGYTYGYKLSKAYSEKVNKSASELVHIEANNILTP